MGPFRSQRHADGESASNPRGVVQSSPNRAVSPWSVSGLEQDSQVAHHGVEKVER